MPSFEHWELTGANEAQMQGVKQYAIGMSGSKVQ